MIKSLLAKIHKIITDAKNRHMLGAYLANAFRGLPNSQLWAAETYFYQFGNYLEAYAWADVGPTETFLRFGATKVLK